MPTPDSQTFLRELDKKLWTAADKLPAGTEILKERGSSVCSYKITSTGKLIDDALEEVEKENPKLKNVPVASVCDRRTLKSRVANRQTCRSKTNRRRTILRKTSDGRRPTLQLQIDPANLAGLAPAKPRGDDGLIDLIATLPCQHADPAWRNEDILGHNSNSYPSNSTSASLGDLCAFAPLRLCAFAPLRLCAFAPLRLCAFAPLRLCG
jgi:hypothetical protein